MAHHPLSCSYREALSRSVMGAFQGKIEAAEEATAQTENLLQQKLAEASSATEAIRMPASLPGLAGEPSSAAAGMLGVAAGAVGMGLLGAVAGSALASKSSARKMWPGLRRSSNDDEEDGKNSEDEEEERVARQSGSDGGAKRQHKSEGGNAGGRLSSGGSYVAKAASSAAGARGTSGSGTAGAAGSKGAGGAGQSKSGDLECYDMFKMFAADDDTLDYVGELKRLKLLLDRKSAAS